MIREQELHYENVFFIVFKLVGFYTQVEYHTSKGRIEFLVNRYITHHQKPHRKSNTECHSTNHHDRIGGTGDTYQQMIVNHIT
ncbi:PD-(D/E)XK nuclease domain-containing protein, partial [Klebsiella pneumoniae]|uniref:PD-(D/E)XK nuclease domain-containing protein n=1 Tax=Klebsiella pneumoniae TaxID=573 RepID=UPI003B59C79E